MPLWRAMRSKNACKTCAFGMGGQDGGMVNEAGHFPEVCKKSLQAMASDMRGRIESRFFETYSLEDLSTFTSRELEALGRICDPIIARPEDTHYRVVSWEEALAHVSDELRDTPPERAFFYASGRSSNEAGFVLHLLARDFGTNHVNNCSYYCHQASGTALNDSIGTGTATVELSDLDKCDLVFLIGANPSSNHPRLLTLLAKLRERGGHVVVVNPVKEVGLQSFRVPSNVKSMLLGSEIASHYVQPRIGGDIAFMAGIAKVLVEESEVDECYIQSFTKDYSTLEAYVRGLNWSEIESGSGLERQQIQDVARLYAHSKRTIFAWSMGITHHQHGTENVHWIVNVALLRGMIGKEGAGVMPIRGHSNVQGMGTIGVSPAMKQAAIERIEALGLKVPAFKGHDTLAAVEASFRGEMDFALCLGGNIYGASPDAAFSHQALAELKTIAYLSTTLNTGHVHGRGKTTVIFPVRARDEESQSTTQESMFNYVRLSDGGPKRYEGPRSEVEVLTEFAKRTLPKRGPLDWEELSSHDAIRGLIAKLVPGMEQVEEIGRTKSEFHIPERVLHQPKFKTSSGKASFNAYPIPRTNPLEHNQLRLMTGRSEGQFNTVVYEEYDLYRGQDRRDVILINPTDMARLELQRDQKVTIRSEVGEMHGILARPFDVALGCAMMYYPEANVLIPRKHDPRSKTPAFKSVVVSVVK